MLLMSIKKIINNVFNNQNILKQKIANLYLNINIFKSPTLKK